MASIEVIDKTFQLLEQLSLRTAGVGVMELARTTGIAASTAHRYLAALQEVGVVARSPDSGYRLTPRLYVLGLPASGVADLERATEPSLRRLMEATGETSCLMVRDGRYSVCVGRLESPNQLKISAVVGRRQDLRLGATSRLLLAYVPDADQDQILMLPPVARRTPKTVSDPTCIRTILESIRSDGYYVSSGEVDEGVVAVAAPVRDRRGEVIASLAIAAPESRMGEQVLGTTVELVVREAECCSRDLGYRPPA